MQSNAIVFGYAFAGAGALLSSSTFAQESNTEILDELKEKYNIDNPRRNHQTTGVTQKMEEQMNRSSTDLTGYMQNQLNKRATSKNYDFSDHADNSSVDTILSDERGAALSIGSTFGAPAATSDGGIKMSYSKEGTRTLTRDASGKLVIGKKTGGGTVNNLDKEDYLSSEISNSDQYFKADEAYGDNSEVLKEGKKSHNVLKTSATSSGRAYQMLTQSAKKVVNTSVEANEPWLNSTWDKLDNVQNNQGEFFQACVDKTSTVNQDLYAPAPVDYRCHDTSQSKMDFCEVERKVRIPVYSSQEGMRSCGLGCYEFDMKIDTWKTSKCRTTYPPEIEANPAIFDFVVNLDDVRIKDVTLSGSATDHFKITANNQSVWASTRHAQSTFGNLDAGSCNVSNQTGAINANVTNSVNSAISTQSGLQTIHFRGDLKWKKSGHFDVTVKVQVEDKTGLGLETQYIQTPAGCYDALTEEARNGNPLKGVYEPDNLGGISHGSYQSNYYCYSNAQMPICKAGETLFGNVTQEVCLSQPAPVTPYCESGVLNSTQDKCEEPAALDADTGIYSCPAEKELSGEKCLTDVLYRDRCAAGLDFDEIMVNGQLTEQCVRQPTEKTSNNWNCTGNQSFTGSCSVSRESFLDENDQVIKTIDSNGYPITPYDEDGVAIAFEDTATCSSVNSGSDGPTEIPKSFCTFDSYQTLEMGQNGYPSQVLDLIPQWFAEDAGNKTWKVNLEGYQCNPTYEDICVIDTDTNEEKCYTWEEVRELPNQCETYIENPKCSEVKRSCADGWLEEQTGRCIADTVTYRCDEGEQKSYQHETTTNICASAIPCAGGDCKLGEEERNGKFMDAAVQANIMQNIDADRSCEVPSDPSTCTIFKGEAEYCSFEVTGLGVDCCEAPAGLNIISYITMSSGMMKMNKMGADGVFGETIQDGSKALIEFTEGAYTKFSEPVSSAWQSLSEPITSAYNSVLGNATGEVITEGGKTVVAEGATESAMGAALAEVQQQVYEFVYDMLPEDLASLLFTETATKEGTELIVNEAISDIMSSVMGAYAVYSYIKLALTLLTMCDENEQDMGVKLGQRQCFAVGNDYCSAKVLGVCYQKRQDYCCYDSILARIIMEQAGPILNKDMSSCEGLSQDELSRLDFKQLDLSEWVGLMLDADLIPSEGGEQNLTAGGDLVETECEEFEVKDPVTGVVTLEKRCFKKMEGGRLINASARQTVSERTTQRIQGAANYSQGVKASAINKVNNLDCSVTPRPKVCEFGFNPADIGE